MKKTENELKYENYREQCKRLDSALKSGFYLEAMFIEYTIMEDRTESILRHAGKWEAYIKSRKGREPGIDPKIRYIQKTAENREDLSHRYFSDGFLSDVLNWKEERNRLIHALLKQHLEHGEIRTLAENGKHLSDALKNRAGYYNRAIDRRKEKGMT